MSTATFRNVIKLVINIYFITLTIMSHICLFLRLGLPGPFHQFPTAEQNRTHRWTLRDSESGVEAELKRHLQFSSFL